MAVLAPVSTLGAAWMIAACSARALAGRTAETVSAYLSYVSPTARGGADYDLGRLLVRARALETLLEETAEVEVYHGTAPLVHAGAPPLTPAELAGLRRDRGTGWWDHAAFAPLYDRDGWAIVGAVRVPPPRLGAWMQWVVVVLVLVELALVGRAAFDVRLGDPVERRVLLWLTGTALCLGLAAYGRVWLSAREATDRWLLDAGALVQEAATRGPGGKGLAWAAPLARGAEVVPGERALRTPVRRRLGLQTMALVTVRLRAGRWAELRTRPAESDAWGWLVWLVGLACAGPVALVLAARPASRGG
ncbi:MAG TPA: hypothetical protein VLV16_10905 [Gemmatimonadales bacterium]|nr:hypothetical protein [Gemmatimonadales bacterium]